MKEMYKGMVNSPQTKIDQAINAADTDIKVKDGMAFPKGPNLAVIGIDKSAETILYSSVNNNILVGCTRGYQGTARNWDVNTPIARNFTEADLNAVQENIRTLDGKTLADISDDENHRTVSDDEKSSWNNKVDKVDGKVLSTNDFTDAAKKKVDAIPPDPKYTDTIQDLSDYVKKTNLLTKLADMADDTNHRLVTDEEKKTWNEKLSLDKQYLYDILMGESLVTRKAGEWPVVHGKPKQIDGKSFKNAQLTNIVIPPSVTAIGSEAFSDNQLTNIVIPPSVTFIGPGAFSGNQLTNIVIPPRVKDIHEVLFMGNPLINIVIPPKVETIGAWAFLGCQLTSVVIPPSVKEIGDQAFEGNKLTEVRVPKNCTVADDAFDAGVNIIRY